MKKIYFLFSIIVLASFSVSNSAFGTEVGTDKIIGSSANSAKDQQLVYCSVEDKFLVIWTGNESGKDQIFYNYQNETDMAGVPITTGILLSSAIDATFRYAEKPKVSYDESSGKATVVWLESNQEGKDSVMMRIIDVANDNLETEIVVASGSTWNMSATVADDNNGGFIVAYYDTTGNDITVKYFDSDGISTRDSVILDTVDSGYLLPYSIDIAYNSQEENYLITWADISTNLFSITLDADGNKGTLNDYSALTDAANPAIAYNDSSNQFFIVYDDFNGNVLGQLTDSVGNLEGVVLEFAKDTNPVKGGFPDVIFNPSNKSFAISWQDYLGGNGIWIQEYISEPCNVISDSVQVSSSTTTNYPVLAYGAVDEKYWIAWFGDVAGKDQIIAQRFKSDFTSVQAICKNIDVYLDANGEFLLHADSIDYGSGVPCGTFTLAISKEIISCDDMPSTQVELVITNEYGETDTCEATVTVIDTFPLAAVCQDITVYLDGTGVATITATDIDGGSTDNCSLGTITASQTSFSCADIGDNTITLTVTDEGGNSSTCDAIVTVTDSMLPVAVCQNITVQLLDATGNVSISPTDIDNGSSDNCGIASLSVSPASFTCADIGLNDVSFVVTDVNGNIATCTAVVTVVDAKVPTPICFNGLTVNLDASGNFTLLPGDLLASPISDNCSDVTLSLSKSDFSCADIGPNVIQLHASDESGNSDYCVTNVIVQDNLNPDAICKDISVSLDAAGNASVIPSDVDGGSTDNCGIASLTVSPASFTAANIGPNNVTLTVTDVNGNSSSCTAIVTVEDNIPPDVQCNSIDIYLDNSGKYVLTATDIDDLLAGTTDNKDAFSDLIKYARPIAFYCDDVGAVKVDLVVEDTDENRGYCRTLVNVIDTTSLKFETVADVFIETEQGVCETQITYPEIVANACATVSQTDGLGADGLFPVGTTIETWKAYGVNGDSVILSFNVVVSSLNAAPSIDSIVNVVGDENTPGINVPLSGISFGDDCVEQDVTITALAQNMDLISSVTVHYTSPDSVGSLDISLVQDKFGKDTITVIVTDSEGVSDSVVFELTINPVNKQPTINAIADMEVEEDSPVISIPLSGISYGNDLEAQIISVTAAGTNPALVSIIVVNYSSSDSTGSIDLTLISDGFGEETITVTVTDSEGGSVSESFVLTVTPVNDAPYLKLPLPDGSVNASYTYELDLAGLMGVVFDDIDDDMLDFDVTQEGTDGLPDWATIESNVLTAIPMIADTGTYSFVVSATDTSGAMVSDTFMLVVEGYPTAVGDFDQEVFDVTMYPNPSKGEVNLKINTSEIKDSEVVVRSITGSEVFRKEYKASEQIKIDLSDQVSGVYLITLQQGNNSLIKKLILDRK